MKVLSCSLKATEDVGAIWDYSADRWGPDQAERYTAAIRDVCRALANGQKRGRPSTVRPGYMKCTSGSHIIWLRDTGDALEVVRVLHSAQDTERNLHD
ncbi:type II toxin-antitoxin system RelE/ParE family toxin [Rhodobacter sp. SGA-6-6]|uniref:type II toxin-antitoxin system RelE/ParE family toxin n=1 Tax=Rhodobacter sp. SGA-6-6 TaxID=2710882 RepID=UPI0013ED95EA|nr:type II toxin-antitoxin system RelE/ParE family toxin [Rhodobacter sp. SGA-6-6]NGM46559.1 type II toxin-antitoxin system RelE/ParE family toxin [Rhodobacter sp. SGA-6-6]